MTRLAIFFGRPGAAMDFCILTKRSTLDPPAPIARPICELDATEWDRMLGHQAYIDAASMRAVEDVFSADAQRLPEYQWTRR